MKDAAMLEIEHAIVIDQHCHSFVEDFLQLDEIGLRQCFSESNSMKMLESHVPFQLSYMHMLEELGYLLGVQGEARIIEFRQGANRTDYLNTLFDDISVGNLIVDDGYRASEMIGLLKLSQILNRRVYRCKRIETVLESSLQECSSFSELEDSFEKRLLGSDSIKTVSLKTIAAYRGGLEIESVTVEDARSDFDEAKKNSKRIERRKLYHYFLRHALILAGRHNMPVQLHTGLGDRDADLRSANPLHLKPLFEDKELGKTQFVMLHCYPYVREAATLCSLYPNAFMDLSLTSFLVSPNLVSLILEALSVAPYSKLLAASDGHTTPETHWYGMTMWRESLTQALTALIETDFINERQATAMATAVLHGNAKELYDLSDA